MRLKFSVYADGRRLTVPASGQAGNVILKFPDERPNFSGVPEAELACLTLASRAGIDAAAAELVSPHDVRGLRGNFEIIGVLVAALCGGDAVAAVVDRIVLNLDRSKSFEAVVPKSFDRLGVRTGFGVDHARLRVSDAVERITDEWHVLTDHLGAEAYRRLTARRDKLALVNP